MPSKRIVLTSVLLAFLPTACSDGPPASHEPPSDKQERKSDAVDPQIVEAFGGKPGLAALQSPTYVEVYRVDSSESSRHCIAAWKSKPRNEKIAGYPIVSGPVSPTAETRQKLQKWLLDPKSHHFGEASKCAFCPGYVLRFVGTDATLEIVICFKCEDMSVSLPTHKGRGSHHSFRPGADALLAILNEVKFSDD